MCKTFKLIIKAILNLITVICLIVSIHNPVSAENLYEYYFHPKDDQSTEYESIKKYEEFFDSLPDEIKEQLPKDVFEGNVVGKSQEMISFKSIWQKILVALKNALFPSLKSMGFIVSVLLIGSLIRHFKLCSVGNGTDKLITTVISAAIILLLSGTDIISLSSVDTFKNYICNIMNGLIPTFGVVYASSGNTNTAAIQSGGIILLITLCHNIFSKILLPSVRICLMMSITNAVFPESGIGPMSSMIKNITVWLMTACVTVFSFILGLQNTIAQTADSIGMRSIKFAVGNLVPIIGGAISDSLGTVGGSLTLLKSAGGSIIIVLLIILILPTICSLVAKRLAVLFSKCIAMILGCTTEAKLLDDLGGAVSMMIAFTSAISISFIYVISLFVRSTLAIIG